MKIKQYVGEQAVKLARGTLDSYFENKSYIFPEELDSIFYEPMGAFVTLNTYPEENLRGCIGYPLPVKNLKDAIVENTINAAIEDPRFQNLRKEELDKIVLEVSILTVPKEVENPLEKLKIGEHGLIIRYGYASGLLLPQVAIDFNFNKQQFLEAVCQKAGLPRDMWQSPDAKVSLFSAHVFYEETPRGKIKRRYLIV